MDRAIAGELGRVEAERAALVYGEYVVSSLLLRQSFLNRLRCGFGVSPLEYISKMAY
jgi:coproporphyrinogen III oxidase-like Fe-S oxidoreductase